VARSRLLLSLSKHTINLSHDPIVSYSVNSVTDARAKRHRESPGGRHAGYALVQGERVAFYIRVRVALRPALREDREERSQDLADLKPELY
jgi:hypothetical protein